MSAMTNDEIKADILDAFAVTGIKPRPFSYGIVLDGQRCGCAMVAVAVRDGLSPDDRGFRFSPHPLDTVTHVMGKYGWDANALADFMGGFDGAVPHVVSNEGIYDLGRAVRAAVLP